jgi:phosphoglycolate phosphatase
MKAMDSASPVVVFDLDGVLIDSAEANVQAFRYGLEQVGVEVGDRDAILSLVGLPALEMLRRLGCPPEAVAEVFEGHVRPFYIENLPALARAYPGAARVLDSLRSSGFRIAACTSGDRRTQTAALQSIGLWEYIEEMQTPDDSSYGKPDPRYLKELLARIPGAGRLHHVEDSEVGIEMGRDCGAVTFFASYGNGALSGRVNPDYVLASLEELPLAILQANSRISQA